MQATFHPDVWADLSRLVQADDGAALAAWAQSAPELAAVALRWYRPGDESGRTLLMLAYWWGKPSAARVLVNAGSDYQQADAAGRNAAWYAARFGKGTREIEMSNAIGAAVRRISMKSAIDGAAPSAPQPPSPVRPRRSGI